MSQNVQPTESPLPLNAKQTAELVELLKTRQLAKKPMLVDLLTNRVPAGVMTPPRFKASFLAAVARGEGLPAGFPREGHRTAGHHAGRLQHQTADRPPGRRRAGRHCRRRPQKTLLVFDFFHDVKELADKATPMPRLCCNRGLMPSESTSRPEVPAVQKITVFQGH